MNIFDTLADAAFDVVTNTMGYSATWLPSSGGPVQKATVLYGDATAPYEMNGVKYDPPGYHFEYRLPFFENLKDMVDNSRKTEEVTITIRSEAKEFFIRRVDTKYDGRTLIAYLEPKED